MSENIFDRFDSETKSLSDKIKGFLTEYFPYLMLFANILFEVLTRLFKIGFSVPFTPDFWASLFINAVSSTLSYACFVFYAERRKKESSTEYLSNCKRWSEISQNVRENLFDQFLAYCKAQYERECEERRVALIVNNTRITIQNWQERYRAMSDKEIDNLVNKGEISASDAKYIKRANRHPRLRPIDPLLILAGMKVNDLNDAGRSNTSSVRSVLTRPIPVVLMSIGFTMFAGTFVGISDSSALFDMLYTAGMIVGSSLMGYAKGVANADKKHSEIKSRIFFIERFEKTIKI